MDNLLKVIQQIVEELGRISWVLACSRCYQLMLPLTWSFLWLLVVFPAKFISRFCRKVLLVQG